MAYTSMSNLAEGTLVTETNMDNIRTNIEYLIAVNSASELNTTYPTAYSTTSTSYVDVDSTNLKHTITTAGGHVFLWVAGSLSSATNSDVNHAIMDIEIDGATYLGDATNGLFRTYFTAIRVQHLFLVTGLGAGSHTFALQYKTTAVTDSAYFKTGSDAANDFYMPIQFIVWGA